MLFVIPKIVLGQQMFVQIQVIANILTCNGFKVILTMSLIIVNAFQNHNI